MIRRLIVDCGKPTGSVRSDYYWTLLVIAQCELEAPKASKVLVVWYTYISQLSGGSSGET